MSTVMIALWLSIDKYALICQRSTQVGKFYTGPNGLLSPKYLK